ncbi:LamG domain-containing protein [Kribbella turkmenica]|uniref:LamG domain-containing protein n=1 Tax=Kribbella turkmenica TaxID=2530375 RepID=A0A4R4X035_9ACTN|nr:LamG domain-containing protein [Kribbella turkmenica]TDD23480.1 LamG domain-containing protein [Kribbella turkmenica]
MTGRRRAVLAALLLIEAATMTTTAAAGATCPTSAYDTRVLADAPIAYWPLGTIPAQQPSAPDCSGHGHIGTYVNTPNTTTMPNGDLAQQFDGSTQYVEFPDAPDLSLTATGRLTIEAWMRPATLQFTDQEGSGYVHWLGKGTSNQQEYVARMYSQVNSENRPNRISGYAFNLTGGLGVGSYFQDPVSTAEWIHVVIVINTADTSGSYPSGYTRIYKNGVLRDTDSLAGLDITPGNGTAPFRIGTRDFASYFEGRIGKVAIYDYELSAADIADHNNTMRA